MLDVVQVVRVPAGESIWTIDGPILNLWRGLSKSELVGQKRRRSLLVPIALSRHPHCGNAVLFALQNIPDSPAQLVPEFGSVCPPDVVRGARNLDVTTFRNE